MRQLIIALIFATPALAEAQVVEPDRWDVRSTIIELAVPGLPRFLQRMARGHSSSERKVLSSGQGMEALLAPDPSAKCTVDSQQVADGHYAQALTCPQKSGGPVHIARSDTYNASGFVGQARVAGTTSKDALRIVLDQHTTRVGS